jgi:hypothetical protein
MIVGIISYVVTLIYQVSAEFNITEMAEQCYIFKVNTQAVSLNSPCKGIIDPQAVELSVC